MSYKYELTGDATEAQFAVPGTGELVTLKKGKTVELDFLVGDLPKQVKVTAEKPKGKNAGAEVLPDEEPNKTPASEEAS